MNLRYEVLMCVSKNPSITQDEIAELLRISKQQVKDTLKGCRQQGQITSRIDDVTGRPGYKITDIGVQRLAAGPEVKAKPVKAPAPAPVEIVVPVAAARSINTILDELLTEVADNVNHPPHYTQGGIECIDAIRAALTDDEWRGYVKGNVLKYIWRERHKGGDESIAKAKWYLERIK